MAIINIGFENPFQREKENIIKNAFKTKHVKFDKYRMRVTFQSSLDETERSAIIVFLKTIDIEISENNQIINCTKEQFAELENLYNISL